MLSPRPLPFAALGALVATFAAGAAAPGGSEIWGDATAQLTRSGGAHRLRVDGAEIGLELPAQMRVDGLFRLRRHLLIAGVTGSPRGHLAGDELFLALADAAGAREIEPPAGRAPGHSRENAVAIPGPGGELAAVAWLEGPSRKQHAVKVATWDGRGFGEPTEIASAGPGSQVALAATALDDGSALLVWARFDGADDEIFWSGLVDGRWSEPARVAADNSVPDVVPALVAVPGGALAAWSRFAEGQYRVVVARFGGDGWSEPSAVGEPGSLFPTLTRTERGALLLHQSSRPPGWTVVDLGSNGRELRRARVETAERSRPIAAADRLLWADQSVELSWRVPSVVPDR